jgi:hypothetical protein
MVAVLTILFGHLLPASYNSEQSVLLDYFLLLVPIPFYLFVQGYLFSNFMIASTASFIHNILRPELIKFTENPNILLNEFWYKRIREKRSGFKYGIFRTPMVMLVLPIAVITIYLSTNFYRLFEPMNEIETYLKLALLSINILLTVLLIIRIIRGDKHLIDIINSKESIYLDVHSSK